MVLSGEAATPARGQESLMEEGALQPGVEG